ncbi:hypothetical protein N7520_000897 [Penicillium odoratum]|uniref:uncharacterized protein n=1 Tax=Penicillium odoratum TaxID=1167516 RepID=UPI002548B7C0|nr:uncharacterized protein N7520_000897 [Penicillium odoratum]KAJ5777651.1 hypothetical protein N7520_000897 [Penicillium odoratum]
MSSLLKPAYRYHGCHLKCCEIGLHGPRSTNKPRWSFLYNRRLPFLLFQTLRPNIGAYCHDLTLQRDRKHGADQKENPHSLLGFHSDGPVHPLMMWRSFWMIYTEWPTMYPSLLTSQKKRWCQAPTSRRWMVTFTLQDC